MREPGNSSIGVFLAGRREIAVFRTGRLWELAAALPVRRIPLADLAGYLDAPATRNWAGAGPTLRELAERARRIQEADLAYPIIVAADGRLLDGQHRLAKAWIQGDATIAAVRFTLDPEPDWWLDPASVPAPDGSVGLYIPDPPAERAEQESTAPVSPL
jgi:hypothetical protein